MDWKIWGWKWSFKILYAVVAVILTTLVEAVKNLTPEQAGVVGPIILVVLLQIANAWKHWGDDTAST